MFFKKGTLVRVTSVDENDILLGVKVGDLFMVTEDDSPVPLCQPIDSECTLDKHALIDCQLEIVKMQHIEMVNMQLAMKNNIKRPIPPYPPTIGNCVVDKYTLSDYLLEVIKM